MNQVVMSSLGLLPNSQPVLEPLLEETFLPAPSLPLTDHLQHASIPWEITHKGHLNQAILKDEGLKKEEFALPLLPLIKSPMKAFFWNYQGAANPHFLRHFRSLVEEHHLQLVVITETRVSGDRGTDICKSLEFPNFYIAELVGFAGGIWLLGNSLEIHCDFLWVTH
ncbi:hypothetical protein ACSBR2_038836 [Camellia fascicularis]